MKASYSATRKPKSPTDWVGQDKFSVENTSNWINGTNGAVSSSYLEDCCVLDASEDNYEGIIVDPERLPSDPNAFASILHSSLLYWRSKVMPHILISNYYVISNLCNYEFA